MPGSLHSRVVEHVGSAIATGAIAPGSTMLAESLENELGVSRSVVREAVRVLQSMGLVTSVKRVGIRVQSPSNWNVFDPQLIQWRLAEPTRGAQLRSLTEVRSAVEPLAAALAAEHAPDDVAAELLSIAARMRVLGRAGDLEGFLALDIEFHRLVLRGSGNEMFAALDDSIAAILRGRTELGLMPEHPNERALQWHVDVADAIQGRHPEVARAAMSSILVRASDEITEVWADTPRVFLGPATVPSAPDA
jgi:DNA-binding FadR family transcriptional regulator